MSIKMEAPHVAGYSSIVSSLAGRASFTGQRTASRKRLCVLPEGENVPGMDSIRQLYEHLPDAVFFMAADNRVSACNRAAVALFGYEEGELLGRKIDLVWSPTPDVQLKGRWADQGVLCAGIAMTKSGARFPVALTVIREPGEKETFTAAVFEDFRTERETLQQVQELRSELARLARIAALGEMTSTLAHELSQPLTSIGAYAEGCGRLMENDRKGCHAELREALSKITQHVLWAGAIVQNIREFAKRGADEKRPEAMHALIHEATPLALAGSRGQGLHTDFQFDAERDIVSVDRIQILQVLTNLLRNAVEATDGTKFPHISIRTRIDDFSHLVVDVSDNGCGIAAEIEEALFRPFVTTKPHGLGMGLALSKRIVEAHGGRISARRGPQHGATLTFSLPLVETTANGERSYDPSRR
ncbi:PAS domain-containing sensor histidine kinase [Rhizobium sp. R339]|uniref:sensor histidine kinase n=1 Tax=Rhizobium sp. R339 TaxID=1764273 RepID=UPI000B53214D|nr:ATP-binding protein [Rhizobium sp. R339]OWV66420.1 PAS domain-containing sensor histidine kinase [Rhizobium sp. R339]